jgi:hypothetical protein
LEKFDAVFPIIGKIGPREREEMKARSLWSNVLIFIGLIGMLVGAVDPLEGSLVILPGSFLVALGAFLGKSPHRRLLAWSFGLLAIGIGALFGLSSVGGCGGNSGRSMWWLLVVLPYPAGWVMGLVGTIGKSRRRRLLAWIFILMSIGVCALLVLGNALGLRAMHAEPRLMLLGVLPYLGGLIIGFIGAVMKLIEFFKDPAQ